jgi:hypothetical protein
MRYCSSILSGENEENYEQNQDALWLRRDLNRVPPKYMLAELHLDELCQSRASAYKTLCYSNFVYVRVYHYSFFIEFLPFHSNFEERNSKPQYVFNNARIFQPFFFSLSITLLKQIVRNESFGFPFLFCLLIWILTHVVHVTAQMLVNWYYNHCCYEKISVN